MVGTQLNAEFSVQNLRKEVQMRRMLRLLLPLMCAAALGACSIAAPGYETASTGVAAKVNQAAKQNSAYYSRSATAQIAIVQNPDFNGGKLSLKALNTIQRYNVSCQHQIGAQVAGPVQTTASGMATYAAGGAGLGLGAKAAFTGLSGGAYAAYGAISTGFVGGVNGLTAGSYAMAAAVGQCTIDFWKDVVHNSPAFRGAHVVIVYDGKRLGDSLPPALRWAFQKNTTHPQREVKIPEPIRRQALPPDSSPGSIPQAGDVTPRYQQGPTS